MMEFNYKKHSLLSEEEIFENKKVINDYINEIKDNPKYYSINESFINLPSDEDTLDKVEDIKKEFSSKNLKYIFLVGIGGSSLGAKAIYNALQNNDIFSEEIPKIIFIETIDPYLKINLDNIQSEEEIVFLFISKSGKTLETLANSHLLFDKLKAKFPEIEKRIIIISNDNSSISKVANGFNLKTVSIPQNIGGRYSVLSVAGLIPLALSGLDVSLLREGAEEMNKKCLSLDLENNPAFISASVIYEWSKKEKIINQNFYFHPQLETIGKWLRQLMAESLGKNSLVPTPVVSIGTNDLHSTFQLDLGGAKDKLISFVISKNSPESTLTGESMFSDLESSFLGKTDFEILKAIYDGVKNSCTKESVPFTEIILEDISEKSLGEYLQFKMIETIFLAKLFSVNAFDQPNVEDYKKNSIKILKNNI